MLFELLVLILLALLFDYVEWISKILSKVYFTGKQITSKLNLKLHFVQLFLAFRNLKIQN